MRTRKSFKRLIFNSIIKFDGLSGSACGHEESMREASDFLFEKTLPLIEEAMKVAHEAGASGVSWEEWSNARKSLVIPSRPLANDRPDRHGDGSDAADYEPPSGSAWFVGEVPEAERPGGEK